MVLNATFNIFQLYSGGQCYYWRKPKYPEKTPETDRRYHIMFYQVFLAVSGIRTDCIGSYKSNCHTITTTMAPNNLAYTLEVPI